MAWTLSHNATPTRNGFQCFRYGTDIQNAAEVVPAVSNKQIAIKRIMVVCAGNGTLTLGQGLNGTACRESAMQVPFATTYTGPIEINLNQEWLLDENSALTAATSAAIQASIMVEGYYK